MMIFFETRSPGANMREGSRLAFCLFWGGLGFSRVLGLGFRRVSGFQVRAFVSWLRCVLEFQGLRCPLLDKSLL